MRKKIPMYWPLAIIVPVAAVAYLLAYGDAATSRAPLAADRVTAELARTMAYGFVGDDAAQGTRAVRRASVGASEAF
jgi:hypothetical protein